MDELIKNVDVKEMGRRFKLVRQRLGLTQTDGSIPVLSLWRGFWVRTSISRMSRFSARTMLSLPLSRQS